MSSSAPAPKPSKGVRAPMPGEEDVVAVRNPRRDAVVGKYPALMAAMERLRQEQNSKDKKGGRGHKTKKSKSKRRLTKKRRM